MTYDAAKLRDELVLDEGYREKPYLDTEGNLTGGIGHLMSKRLSPAVVDVLYANDIAEAEATLDSIEARWRVLGDEIQRVLMNLSFNLGAVRLVQFRRFWSNLREYIDTGNQVWLGRAADELLDSRAAKQTGQRYTRLANRLRAA